MPFDGRSFDEVPEFLTVEGLVFVRLVGGEAAEGDVRTIIEVGYDEVQSSCEMV